MQFSKCWYESVCEEEEQGTCKPEVCHRYLEMDYLMSSSCIPKKKQLPDKLQAPKVDYEAFCRLAEIKSNIVDFVNDGKCIYLCSDYFGNGKAQPLDSLIMTPTGYTTMRDINIGDNIFGEDGKIHQVVGKFDRGVKDIYRVSFSDGTSTLCCDEHLWNIRKRSNKTWVTVALKELLNKPLYEYNRWVYNIPVCKPLEFDSIEHKLHPYVLGVLIGDGHLDSSGITVSIPEPDIKAHFEKLLPTNHKLKVKSVDSTDYRLVSEECAFIAGRNTSRNVVKQSLKSMGLLNKLSYHKFIPHEYIFTSYEDRIELLRGLIDTDGFINKNSNTISYSTSSKQLAEDFKLLVQTLGGTVNIKVNETPKYTYKGEEKFGKPSYVCWCKFPSSIIPFSSIKHSNRFAYKQQFEPHRAIISIEYVGGEHCMCIKTNNPTELYLTNDCIVTHNTTWATKLMTKFFDEIWYGNGFRTRGLYIHVPTFLMRCKDFENMDSELIRIKRLLPIVDLVIWDDLTGISSSYDYSQLLIYLNARDNEQLSNIFTSNITEREKLSDLLGERITSRIWNNRTEIIEFKGGDMR